MSRAAAAPRCSRRIGLATVVLGLAGLCFAASQAPAGHASPGDPSEATTTTATAQAPAPDPKPAPRPDPKPAQPKPKPRVRATTTPPPPPPPATKQTARRSTAAPTNRRPAQRTTLRKRAETSGRAAGLGRRKAAARKKAAAVAAMRRAAARKKAAAIAEMRARRRAQATAARKAARKQRAARAKKVRILAAQKRARRAGAGSQLDHEALPAPLPGQAQPRLSLAAPVFLPLVGVGLLLLLGASALSVRQIPWPAAAQPLYARRSDVAAIGFGAIALGLLLLNATVFF